LARELLVAQLALVRRVRDRRARGQQSRCLTRFPDLAHRHAIGAGTGVVDLALLIEHTRDREFPDAPCSRIASSRASSSHSVV